MTGMIRLIAATLLLGAMSGCALITTPVKIAGAAAATTIETSGAIVSAPFKMAGDSEE
ncbi:MAG: hypothetical protein JXR25_17000 [Pontiellaceae bacterium]|nr:hypothetical protein [Pontiellaceae bacterium]MBN2786520.1 hypothetical protein [Pontiellaceae bacterium]